MGCLTVRPNSPDLIPTCFKALKGTDICKTPQLLSGVALLGYSWSPCCLDWEIMPPAVQSPHGLLITQSEACSAMTLFCRIRGLFCITGLAKFALDFSGSRAGPSLTHLLHLPPLLPPSFSFSAFLLGLCTIFLTFVIYWFWSHCSLTVRRN